MPYKRTHLVIGLSLFISFISLACTNSTTTTTTTTAGATNSNQGLTYPDRVGNSTFEVAGELAQTFESVQDISRHSKAIAVVEVSEVSHEVKGQLPYTIAQATVRESIAGTLTVGQTVTLGEVGGPISAENKSRPGEFGEARTMTPGGVMPLAAGRSYLVFLDGPARIGPVASGAYIPIGAYQGKMLIVDGDLVFDGDPSKLTSGELSYAVARELVGRPWSDVKKEIEATLATRP